MMSTRLACGPIAGAEGMSPRLARNWRVAQWSIKNDPVATERSDLSR